MMLKEKVHIAVPTAFYEDESLNLEGTITHIWDLYKQGVKSVLVSGTTGEQHCLSLQEKIAIINRLEEEEELFHHMEVIFGVASVRQKEAEELAATLRHSNITGIMIGFPPYIIPTQKEAYAYAKSIIEQSEKPAILYNNPGRTGFDLAEESIVQLSRLEAVIGVKDAGEQVKIQRIQKGLNRHDFYFYAGGEVELQEKVSYGYNRLSSIAGNVYPTEITQWFQKLGMKQKLNEQESIKIAKILEQVYDGNAIMNVKKILNQHGIAIGRCRSPIGNSEK